MNLENFMKKYKNTSIKKETFLEILNNNFENIKINNENEFTLIASFNEKKYGIEYTIDDYNDNCINILNTYIIPQVLKHSKL